ncbi:copper resistance protein CopC [Nonomuraea sp. NPDC049714]|uniref:copper resistance CopC family protein n=1 Tax=Nonomuraea sp. NPDC049714 TaxID=3364357 RepID=UPI0037903836
MAIAPRSILAALICGLLVLFCSPAALAHDRLKASSPAKDAEVTSLDEIELEFSARVRMPFVILRNAQDRQVQIGEPAVEGKFVRAEVPAPLVAGTYVIAWRVVSSDGHPIEGEIPFTVEGEPSPDPTTPASATAPSTGPNTAPNTGPSTAPSVSATTKAPAEPASAESGGGIPAWIWVAAVVLALLGVGLWLVGAKAKRQR